MFLFFGIGGNMKGAIKKRSAAISNCAALPSHPQHAGVMAGAGTHAACFSGKSAGVIGAEPSTGNNSRIVGCRHVGM